MDGKKRRFTEVLLDDPRDRKYAFPTLAIAAVSVHWVTYAAAT